MRAVGTSVRRLIMGLGAVLGMGVGVGLTGQAHALGCDPVQTAKLLADDGAADDWFGCSVSVNGNTAVVGAYRDDDHGGNSGSAYVFEKIGGIWSQTAKLTADDGAADDHFGCSVSVSGDTAVVGAVWDDDHGSYSGSAYVFEKIGGVWTQTAKLTADDGAHHDYFGCSVSISGDTAIVGAAGDDNHGSDSGSAYVFEKVGGVWTQATKLTADDGAEYDLFGNSVSVSGDTAVVGARHDDDQGSDSGSAYVFEKVGGVWTQAAKLTADDGAEYDCFGESVSVSGDTAVVGAFFDDDDGDNSGSAYVFEKVGGVWTQAAKLTADDAAYYDLFGNSVSVSGDTAVVGAYGDYSSGSAYVFEKVSGVWTQAAKFTADDAAYYSDIFGCSVSVSGDTAVVGARGDDDQGDDSGSAYVFDLNCDCPGDLDGDGDTDQADLGILLASYDVDDGGDLDGDGDTDQSDLGILLADYGCGTEG